MKLSEKGFDVGESCNSIRPFDVKIFVPYLLALVSPLTVPDLMLL